MNILSILARRARQNLELATLQNNDQVSKSVLAKAIALGTEVNEAVYNRGDAIKGRPAIDPDFAMPAGNWDSPANDHLRCYRMLASLELDEIRTLRIRSQNFTGNNLAIMAPGEGTSGTSSVVPGFEAKWSEATRDQVITHWDALTNGLSSRHILNAPNILGEVGWWHDDRIVNVDMNDYQERMSLLALSGVLDRFNDRQPRVLEIGGGYGALCLGLMSALKPRQYVICDLPESLLFSGIYLAMAQRATVRLAADALEAETRGEICLLPNYLAEVLMPGQKFDLVINTLSMSEMAPHQVTTYGRLISSAIGTAGAFFEQNHDNRPVGLIDCKEHLASCFRKRQDVDTNPLPVTRGLPVIWSN